VWFIRRQSYLEFSEILSAYSSGNFTVLGISSNTFLLTMSSFQVLEVQHVSSLPCLESLDLSNNPITIVLDYRTKIFELFKDRAKEVHVNNGNKESFAAKPSNL